MIGLILTGHQLSYVKHGRTWKWVDTQKPGSFLPALLSLPLPQSPPLHCHAPKEFRKQTFSGSIFKTHQESQLAGYLNADSEHFQLIIYRCPSITLNGLFTQVTVPTRCNLTLTRGIVPFTSGSDLYPLVNGIYPQGLILLKSCCRIVCHWPEG